MKKLALSAATIAALGAALFYAATQQPGVTQPYTYALILTARPASEEGDSGLVLGWPTDPAQAAVTETLVRVPVSPDAPVIVRPLATYLIPRGDLSDGLTVEVWPGGSHLQCATALPESEGCEALTAPLEGEEWQPARACSNLAPGRWRGACAPRPCFDVSELPLGSSMPAECR